MELEEIEIWYEEEKQMLSEKFMKNIAAGLDGDKRVVKFNKAFKKLQKKYEAKHTAFDRKKKANERRKQIIKFILKPFAAIIHLFIYILKIIYTTLALGMSSKYGQVKFIASLYWMRHAHKIIDPIHNLFRPIYYWYCRYLGPIVIPIIWPFVRMRRYLIKKWETTKDRFKAAIKLIWKGIKIAAKFVYKILKTNAKYLLAKQELYTKKYNEWYAKRVQAKADRKQAKKEAKEAKLKEKEETLKAKQAEKEGKTTEGNETKEDGEKPAADDKHTDSAGSEAEKG